MTHAGIFKLSAREKALLAHHLASVASRGGNLPEGLRLLAGSELLSGTGTRHCAVLADRLEAGESLSSALASMPRSFGPDEVALIAAGEGPGRLADVLPAWAELAENRWRFAKIGGTMLYPASVAAAASLALGVLAWKVLPTFESLAAQLGREVGAPVRALVAFVDFTSRDHMVALALIVFAVVGWWLAARDARSRQWRDRIPLMLPLVGPVLRRRARCSALAVIAAFARAGRGLPDALRQAAAAERNAWLGKQLAATAERLAAGEALGGGAAGPLDGATTHALGAALASVDAGAATAALAQRESAALARHQRRAASLLPSLAVLAVGAFVAFMLISVYSTYFGTPRLVP